MNPDEFIEIKELDKDGIIASVIYTNIVQDVPAYLLNRPVGDISHGEYVGIPKHIPLRYYDAQVVYIRHFNRYLEVTMK